MSMLIKDLSNGSIREYGSDCHDSLEISWDGKTLSYYNLQNGEGSGEFGNYRFVMEDGKIPSESETPEAINCCNYFNIGGFDKQDYDFIKQWKDDVMESLAKYDANSVEEVYQLGIKKGMKMSKMVVNQNGDNNTCIENVGTLIL